MYYPDVLTEADYAVAEQNGISRNTAYNRVRAGWKAKTAITQPVKEKAKHGTGYTKYKATALISEATFYERLRDGWDPDKAAHTPPTGHADRRVEHTGRITAADFATAAANGIKEATVKGRVYTYKWDVQDAITLPVGSKNPKRKGRKYRTQEGDPYYEHC